MTVKKAIITLLASYAAGNISQFFYSVIENKALGNIFMFLEFVLAVAGLGMLIKTGTAIMYRMINRKFRLRL